MWFFHRFQVTDMIAVMLFLAVIIIIIIIMRGGSVAEWLACWTQAQKGLGSNRSRDAVLGKLFTPSAPCVGDKDDNSQAHWSNIRFSPRSSFIRIDQPVAIDK